MFVNYVFVACGHPFKWDPIPISFSPSCIPLFYSCKQCHLVCICNFWYTQCMTLNALLKHSGMQSTLFRICNSRNTPIHVNGVRVSVLHALWFCGMFVPFIETFVHFLLYISTAARRMNYE